MIETIGTQSHVFLCSVVGGAVIAFLFDLFRIFRKNFRTPNIVTYIQDIVFWIAVAFIMFFVVYISNDGQLRSYIFLGAGLGVIFYGLLLSKPVIMCSDAIIRLLRFVFKTLYTVISYPVKLLFRLLSVPVLAIGRFSSRAADSLRRAGRNKLTKAGMNWRMFRNLRRKI